MKTHINKLSSGITLSGVGVMSGTSTDGIDLAAVNFSSIGDKYEFRIDCTKFIEYPEEFSFRLLQGDKISGRDLRILDIELAELIANEINVFLKETGFHADYIASHGHTIFHSPIQRYTHQIGSGATIAALTGIKTVSDFRQSDVSLGGQGAPLVPIGDLELFADYDYCLNLGGFANISHKQNNEIKAFDICALNVVLNELAQKKGLVYDEGGALAASGKLQIDLLNRLEDIGFYRLNPPKSLGTEWVREFIEPILGNYLNNFPLEDIMHTYTIHASSQIAKVMVAPGSNCLATGGGCKNTFLMDNISQKASNTRIDFKNEQLVDFKEAVIFAFLGYLRLMERKNVIQTISGAARAVSAGAVYLP